MKTLIFSFFCLAAGAAIAQTSANRLATFRSETNLVAKHKYVRELMMSGGDEVFIEFKRGLLDSNLSGRRLNLKEDMFMLSLVHSMGYLAITSNITRDFLVEATDPRFWKTNISWKTDLGEQAYSVLAGWALVALAESGRTEFTAIAEKVKTDPSVGGLQYSLASALVDAHFYKQLVETKGWESFLKMSSEEVSWAFPEWKKTSAGTNLFNWYLRTKYPE